MPAGTLLFLDYLLDGSERIGEPILFPSPSPSSLDPLVLVFTQEVSGQPSSGGGGGRWIYLPSNHHDPIDSFCKLVFIFVVSTVFAFLCCVGSCNPRGESQKETDACVMEDGKMCKI